MSDMRRNVYVLGVTGGIGCGKSEVGRILEEMGFAVCDADVAAHDLMKKGSPVFQQVIEHFGPAILGGDGEIDRLCLGRAVFGHPGKLTMLNRLVHPAVRVFVREWIAEQRKGAADGAVLIPLLFESEMDTLDWDAVLCVSSRHQDAVQRLEQRGLSREEAELRIKSQMPLPEKEKRADFVVPNNGTLEDLERMTRDTVKAITGERYV
jgi:dephospho-CoA kinase